MQLTCAQYLSDTKAVGHSDNLAPYKHPSSPAVFVFDLRGYVKLTSTIYFLRNTFNIAGLVVQ